MKKYLFVMVPWSEYFRDDTTACFFDAHGKCMDAPGIKNDAAYQKQFIETFQAEFIKDAVIVFAAKEPTKNEQVVVGWYKHAVSYRQLRYNAHASRNYRVVCDTENAFLLPVEERNYVITAQFDDYFFPAEADREAISKYITQSEKVITPLDLQLCISAEALLKEATPEYLKDLWKTFNETYDVGLLPQLYGHAAEWAAREPNASDAWVYKGFALLILAWPEKALECFERALTIDQNHAPSLKGKGECLIRLERDKDAIEFLNGALEKVSNECDIDDIRLLLSDAYLFTGFPNISYRFLKEVKTEAFLEQIAPRIAEIEQDMPYLLNEHRKDFVLDAYPVFLPFDKEPLPEIYKDSAGAQRYIDPVRQKGIAITPEETVRQQVISYLHNQKEVPLKYMLAEESLSHIDKELRERVDLLVQCRASGKARNLLLVECKAPGIPLGGETTRQALRYNHILRAPYVLLTNGTESHIYHYEKDEDAYSALSALPSYAKMCQDIDVKAVALPQIVWERPAFERLSDPKFIERYRYEGLHLGEDVPDELAPMILNLVFCLLDDNERVPCPFTVPGCTIIKDYGVKPMSTGNPGGGNFFGNYRWFGIKDRFGKRQNVYLAIFSTMKTENDPHWGTLKGRSYFYFAIEERGNATPMLQIDLDVYLKPQREGYRLTHNGARSRKKIQPLIDFISETVPELLGTEERICLGWLDGSKNLSLQDKETAEVIGKGISYVLLRSELREKEKKQAKRRKAKKS